MVLTKKNKKKSLLIIIGGVVKGQGINRRFYQYKVMIKEKFQAQVVKPYTLLFPYELNKEEVAFINKLLGEDTKYKWFTVLNG